MNGTKTWAGRSAFRTAAVLLALAGVTSVASNAGADPDASAPSGPTSRALTRHGSAFVDPLGFALFGPRIGVEVGGGRLSVAAYARWFNAGLLAHSLFLNSGDSFGLSYGGGLRARYYLADIDAGVHLGVAAEYLHTRVVNTAEQVATNSGYFVPYAEVGYRLPLGSFYADGSAGFGYAFRLSGTVEDLPGGSSASSFQAQDDSSVYGTASLDLGVFF
jgi:hypothetical protein